MIGFRRVRQFCLVPLKGFDRFIARKMAGGDNNPKTIEHCGDTYHRTQKRTDGGYVIYIQKDNQ